MMGFIFRQPPRAPYVGLSFSSRKFVLIKYLQLALLLTALAETGLTIYWYWESTAIRELSGQFEQALAHQRDATKRLADDMRQADLALTQEQIDTTRREIAFANQLTLKRAFSWTEMLYHLEHGMPPHVSIHSVRLNFLDATLSLRGTVASMQDLNALTTKLNAEGAFTRVGLTEHARQLPSNPINNSQMGLVPTTSVKRPQNEAITFSLVMTYHPTY